MQKNLPDRPAMKFDNRYIGKVVNVDDPKKQLRVKVRVYGVFISSIPDSDLPWAETLFPCGSRGNEGFTTSVVVGDYVWVDFPFSGNTRRPRILGSVHYCPDGTPNAPDEMWVGPGALIHTRTGTEPVPVAREYYQNNVYSQDGIVIEIPKGGNGALIVTQRATGTAIEITESGHITIHSEKNLYLSAKENCEIVVVGDVNAEIGGDVNAQVGGAFNAEIDGDAEVQIGGDGIINSTGMITISGTLVSLNP